MAGRGAIELEDQIGFFVNTVVLRDVLDPAASFYQVLEAVRQTALSAFTYQDYPFDAIIEELDPVRRRGRHPLFDVWVVLQDTRARRLELAPDLVLRVEDLDYEISLFDLSFQFEEMEGEGEGEGELRFRLQFDRELYEEATIELMAARFAALIKAAVAAPGAPIGALDLDPAEERTMAGAAPVFSDFDFN